VAVGLGTDGDLYVLADRTLRASPDGWARTAVDLYDAVEGDRVVAEVNNGGDLVEHVLRTVDPSVPYRKVTASRGKRLRAEPVAALYEQGRVHHVGQLGELEDQMVSWVPVESGGKQTWSPDRLDALVWAVTDLVLSPVKKRRSVVVAA
jgi:phage terminase large subunit-like protein